MTGSRLPGPGLLALGWRCELWADGATVQLGPLPEPLDPTEHQVWSATLGAPTHPAGEPWTVADVTRTSQVAPETTAQVLAGLVDRGLVVGIDPADPGPAAGELTLLPLAEGWGNTAADPFTFRYGLDGVELVGLPRVLHDAVSLAGCWPDLRSAAAGLAALAREAGVPAPEAHDADALLRLLTGSLPMLCSVGVVALQPARYR